MALARDHPRAILIGKESSVGLVDIPLDELSDGASDGAYDTGSSIADDSNVGGGKVEAGKWKRKRKRKERSYDPSKIQMARTFSKCLPK